MAQRVATALDRAWSAGVDLDRFGDLDQLEAALPAPMVDVVLCDLPVAADLGEGELVERVVAAAGSTPVIVLIGSRDPSFPVQALEIGAQDYLSRESIDVESLSRSLRYSMARSRAEEALRRANHDLEIANADLEEYLGIMAHDLGAPLRTARLFADRLQAAYRAGTDREPMARSLDEAFDRMQEMIDTVLTLSQLRDGRLDPVEEPLSAAVEDVVSLLYADLDQAGGRVDIVPDGPVRADQQLLRDLLRQLTKNSIDYRSPDRDLMVHFGVEVGAHRTTITVRDNGIGIEPRYRDRVFRLFERIDPRHEGLGFGLAYSRRIVELHRGTISMFTPPDGVGNESRIVLPARL